MKNELRKLSIYDISQLYRKKELSPKDTVKELISVIEEDKHYINAFVSVIAEKALADAEKSEKRFLKGEALGMMDGIPYGVKDIFFTKDAKTTMASRVYQDFTPEYNASVVDRLEAGGAILLGKTNTHEFACNPMADISIFGPCRNPSLPERTACGSSCGSGAALAAYMVPATLGSDTSGSVRIPAAACGVVGMRPTQGLVSRFGVYPLSYSIDAVGPMTRTVRDNAILLNAISGYDCRDEMSMPLAPVDYMRAFDNSELKGLRFAVPEDLGTANPIDDEVRASFMAVVDLLRSRGAEVNFIPPLDADGENEAACRALRITDAYCAHKKDMDRAGELYTREIYDQMLGGANASAADYVFAARKRLEFQVRITELFGDYDAIITPTLPIVAPRIGDRIVKIAGGEYSTTTMLTCLTVLPSFMGFPSISIPCGRSGEGLPIGVQLTCGRFGEYTAYKTAYALEQALDFKL